MTIQNVCNKDVKAPAAAAPETFKGYTVVDGKVQGSFYNRSSTIKSLQEEYDAEKAKNAPFTWKTPFVKIGNAVTFVANWFVGVLKSIFALCTYSKKAADDKTAKKA